MAMFKKILKLVVIFCVFLFITGICAYLTILYSIKNEDIIVVPELVGRDVVSVLEQLSDLGLNTKVKGSEFTLAIPKNHVISQDPEAGTAIKEDRDVRIIFSKGPRSIPMPSLKKTEYRNAGLILDENGLKEGFLSYTFHNEIPKDTIIDQFPRPGTEVIRGSKADLLISRGKRLNDYMMADLRGYSIDEAIFHLEKKRLVLGEIKSVPTDKVPKNIITDHDPQAGYRVIEGKKVNLVINRPSRRQNRIFQHDAGARLFRYKLDNGFLKKHIKAQLSYDGIIDEIINDFIKPGEEIWIMIPCNTEATVFLYEDDHLIKTEYYN